MGKCYSDCVRESGLDGINIWIKALPDLGEPLPISWRPEQNKRSTLLQETAKPSCLTTWARTSVFLLLGLELKHGLFLGLEPASLWTVADTIGSPESQVLRLRRSLHQGLSWTFTLLTAYLGTCQPPKPGEPISYNKHAHTRLVLFFWRTLNNILVFLSSQLLV